MHFLVVIIYGGFCEIMSPYKDFFDAIWVEACKGSEIGKNQSTLQSSGTFVHFHITKVDNNRARGYKSILLDQGVANIYKTIYHQEVKYEKSAHLMHFWRYAHQKTNHANNL